MCCTTPQKKHKHDVKSVIADLRRWREGINWGKGISISHAKKEGRDDESRKKT